LCIICIWYSIKKTTTIKFERILAGSYCVLFVFGSGLALLWGIKSVS
jgi:hypothetical protein